MTKPALKPCPFCGNEPNLSKGLGNFYAYWIECAGPCLVLAVSTGGCDTEEEAINAWNTRSVPEDKP